MRQSLARYSATVSFVHAPSLADFITTIVGFEVFGTHSSGCFRLERLPGGTCTHWKAPPFHGAHPYRTSRLRTGSPWRCEPSLARAETGTASDSLQRSSSAHG